MALPATMRKFEIALADSDRNVYEQLDWRVAQHPSESERYLVARVVARALEHAEGLEFSKGGVSDDDQPALSRRDLRGDLQAWIEIGSPTGERLHKASKASPRVAVYTWKAKDVVAGALDRKIYKLDALEVYALDPAWLDRVAGTLDRTNSWDLAVTGGAVYLSVRGQTYETAVERVAIE